MKEDNNKEAESKQFEEAAERLKEITYAIIDMHGAVHNIAYIDDVENYVALRSEEKDKEIARYKNLLHMANQMLITYEMRYPDDEDCLVGRTNAEAKELIEQAIQIR